MIDKISIIIPTRNRTEKLKRAVLSVVNQYDDLFDIELVIVDDNDTDNITDITICLQRIISSTIFVIKIIRNNEEHSAANARNLGVINSTGRFITFLDDDDIFISGRLLLMYKIIKNNSYDYISTHRLYEKNNLDELVIPKKQLSGLINLDKIKLHNDIDISILLEKTLFIDIGMFDSNMKALEDWDLIIRLHLNNKVGYKIKNYFSLVNNDQDVVRVTNNESSAYSYIANKYRKLLGDKWYYQIEHKSLLTNSKLNLIKSIKCSLMSMSYLPLLAYFKFLIRNYNNINK